MSNQLLTATERAILAEPEETPAAEPEPTAKPEPAEETPAAASTAPFIPQAPQYDTAAIQDALDTAGQQQADLQRRFDDGELSIDEFVIEQSQISDQKAQAMAAAAIAENNLRSNEEFEEQLWSRDQKEFFRANPQYEQNPALFGALDQMVQTIAMDPSNQDKTGAWVLDQAKKEVESQLHATGGAARAASNLTSGQSRPSAPVAAADLSGFEQQVEAGGFRDIESRLGHMSAAEADEFLRGGK